MKMRNRGLSSKIRNVLHHELVKDTKEFNAAEVYNALKNSTPQSAPDSYKPVENSLNHLVRSGELTRTRPGWFAVKKVSKKEEEQFLGNGREITVSGCLVSAEVKQSVLHVTLKVKEITY